LEFEDFFEALFSGKEFQFPWLAITETGFFCNFLLTKLASHPNMALVKISDRKGGGEKAKDNL
jgi:hypothetical protein